MKNDKCIFNDISECKAGFYGDSCDEPCPPGSFGLKCGGKCLPRCTSEECDHVSGCSNFIKEKKITHMIVSGMKNNHGNFISIFWHFYGNPFIDILFLKKFTLNI